MCVWSAGDTGQSGTLTLTVARTSARWNTESKREGKASAFPSASQPRNRAGLKTLRQFCSPETEHLSKKRGRKPWGKTGERGFVSPKTPVLQPRNRAPSQSNPPPVLQPRNRSNTKNHTKPQPRNHHNQPPKRGQNLGVRLGAGLSNCYTAPASCRKRAQNFA